MTLILACITPTHVFQVSDRRLTWIGGVHSGAVVTDEQNKAVLLNGQIAFGYTGLANLGGEGTDTWLSKVLGDVVDQPLAHVVETLRRRATAAMAAAPVQEPLKRHAFLGTGWAEGVDGDKPEPIVFRVDNALDREGNWIATPRIEFSVTLGRITSLREGFQLFGVGVHLPPAQRNQIHRFLGRIVTRRRSPAAILTGMFVVLRWLAKYHPTIGRSVMGVCMPKPAREQAQVNQHRIIGLGAPRSDMPTFVHIGPTGSVQTEYSPIFVSPGWIVSNFSMRTL